MAESKPFSTRPGSAYYSRLKPYSLVCADLNRDGKDDVVLTYEWGQAGVFLSNGDGTFTAVTSFSTHGHVHFRPTLGDFNSDSIPDYLQGNAENRPLKVRAPNRTHEMVDFAEVLLGKGDGTFSSSPVKSDVYSRMYSGAIFGCGEPILADLNRDGILDLVIDQDYLGGTRPRNSIVTMLGNGDGTFKPSVTIKQSNKDNFDVTCGDLNKDGFADIVARQDGSIIVLLGNGDGTMRDGPAFPPGIFQMNPLLADLNGDGRADLILSQKETEQGSLNTVAYLGNGDGTFAAPRLIVRESRFPWTPLAGDFNGDGKGDLVINNTLCLSNGDGTFQTSRLGSGIYKATGDFNGDGKQDLALILREWYCWRVVLCGVPGPGIMASVLDAARNPWIIGMLTVALISGFLALRFVLRRRSVIVGNQSGARTPP